MLRVQSTVNRCHHDREAIRPPAQNGPQDRQGRFMGERLGGGEGPKTKKMKMPQDHTKQKGIQPMHTNVVGSSATTRGGLPHMAIARARRRRIPPLSLEDMRVEHACNPVAFNNSSCAASKHQGDKVKGARKHMEKVTKRPRSTQTASITASDRDRPRNLEKN